MRKVEQLVVDHYRTVQLPPERIAEIRDVLRRHCRHGASEAEAAEQSLTLRIQRLTNERQKLLQLHYADAVPIELFRAGAGAHHDASSTGPRRTGRCLAGV